jgi:hypothetical protein
MEKEVRCDECGAYFMLLSNDTDSGEIYGTCPECEHEGEHVVTEGHN